MNTTENRTSMAAAAPSDHRAAMNKGVAMGALGALAAGAVIGGAAWFALTRDGNVEQQANRVGTPTTVIGDATSPAAGQAQVPAPVQQAAPVRPQAPATLPPPVYQPQAPVAQAAPPAPPAARQAPVERQSPPVALGRPGVIASVREVNVKGEANGVGAAVGGVVGGLLGHQLGGGSGRTALTIAGAVGGGLAGHEVQKRVNGTKVYNVTVQFDDGTTETLRESTASAWRPGDRVRVRNGVIRSDNA